MQLVSRALVESCGGLCVLAVIGFLEGQCNRRSKLALFDQSQFRQRRSASSLPATVLARAYEVIEQRAILLRCICLLLADIEIVGLQAGE